MKYEGVHKKENYSKWSTKKMEKENVSGRSKAFENTMRLYK